jgi:hypothetical protein
MNEGVKILLERMKTNPEEFDFNGRDGKWENLVYRYSDWLDEEDKIAFRDAMKQMRQEKFTQEIMKELLAPEDDSLGKPWYTTRAKGTPLAGTTQGVTLNSALHPNTLQNVTITTDPLINKKLTVKKHQTLFGKLFNYS